MDNFTLRAVLDWMMCSDPFPVSVDKAAIDAWLNGECMSRGYTDWVDAYHRLVAS